MYDGDKILNMGEQRGAACFIQSLPHGSGEEGERFCGSRCISRGRYLASGLEPDCKLSSCFYQMGANLSQNKWALACTVLEGTEEGDRWDLNCPALTINDTVGNSAVVERLIWVWLSTWVSLPAFLRWIWWSFPLAVLKYGIAQLGTS